MSSSYIVTTSIRGTRGSQGASRTQIWDSSSPLPLGHPFRWVLERTARGVRVRDVSLLKSKSAAGAFAGLKELAPHSFETGASVELDESLSLSIRPVTVIEAPFFTGRSAEGKALAVFACAGNWVLDSQVLGAAPKYIGRMSKQAAFELSPVSADAWMLKAVAAGLKLQLGSEKARELGANESLQLTATQLLHAVLRRESHAWRFGLTQNPDAPAEVVRKEKEKDAVLFNQALRYAGIALASLVALSWIWPQPKPETQELIPPQFAKIVLSKPKSADGPAAGEKSANPVPAAAANAPKKVQEAAVVQAFRAKALSNAVSGLLKGGMTKLMAQSDFVEGTRQSQEARSLFNTKSNSLRATGPDTGLMDAKNVQVASIGGGVGAGGGGGGVGYGKGTHAGVKGQGGSFVTMDTGASSVDEGLSKDEVGEVIHRHMSEVRYCYESAMARTPDIEGKLITNFVIGGNGMVKTTEVKSSTLPDPRLDDCILRRLATWKFPNPRGGVTVAVSYPFIFKTLGR